MKSGSVFGDIEYTEKHEAFIRERVVRLGILTGHFQTVLFFSKEQFRTLCVIKSDLLCCKFRNHAFGLESGFS